jgi:hypothetical protein
MNYCIFSIRNFWSMVLNKLPYPLENVLMMLTHGSIVE